MNSGENIFQGNGAGAAGAAVGAVEDAAADPAPLALVKLRGGTGPKAAHNGKLAWVLAATGGGERRKRSSWAAVSVLRDHGGGDRGKGEEEGRRQIVVNWRSNAWDPVDDAVSGNDEKRRKKKKSCEGRPAFDPGQLLLGVPSTAAAHTYSFLQLGDLKRIAKVNRQSRAQLKQAAPLIDVRANLLHLGNRVDQLQVLCGVATYGFNIVEMALEVAPSDLPLLRGAMEGGFLKTTGLTKLVLRSNWTTVSFLPPDECNGCPYLNRMARNHPLTVFLRSNARGGGTPAVANSIQAGFSAIRRAPYEFFRFLDRHCERLTFLSCPLYSPYLSNDEGGGDSWGAGRLPNSVKIFHVSISMFDENEAVKSALRLVEASPHVEELRISGSVVRTHGLTLKSRSLRVLDLSILSKGVLFTQVTCPRLELLHCVNGMWGTGVRTFDSSSQEYQSANDLPSGRYVAGETAFFGLEVPSTCVVELCDEPF